MALGPRLALLLGVLLVLGAAPAVADPPSLVVTGPRGLYRAEVTAPHHRTLAFRFGRYGYGDVEVSPSGRILVGRSPGLDGNVRVLEVGGDGSVVRIAEPPPASCLSHTAISPDGRLVAWAAAAQGNQGCRHPSTIHLATVDTGAETELPAPARAGMFGTRSTFSRDGSLLLSTGRVGGRSVVRVFDTATGAVLRDVPRSWPTDLPAPGGAVVLRVVGRVQPGCRLVTVDPRAGTAPTCWDRSLRLTASASRTISASPDGRTLAWTVVRHGTSYVVVAPARHPSRQRVLGPAHTGPGRATAHWVGNRFVATVSPEDDSRAVLRARDGRVVWQDPPPPFYGWGG
jgi:WD40 repeat protein